MSMCVGWTDVVRGMCVCVAVLCVVSSSENKVCKLFKNWQ